MIEKWVRANWHWLAIGVLAVLLAFQTLRIEGLRMGHVKMFGADFWAVDIDGFKPALAQCEADRAAIITAQDEAAALQAAANEDEERRTAANAERSDIAHAQDLERAVAAGRSFADRNSIAAGGVRPQGDRGAPGQAAAPAQSGSAGLSSEVPADSFVAVASADVQACTTAVTYAVGAFNWAQTLPAEAAPEPPPAQ
jgi:hypothetical protein